jgi:transcriptional antiterminator NusG
MPDEIANNEFEPAEAPSSGETEAGADGASADVSTEGSPDHDIAVTAEPEAPAESAASEEGDAAPSAPAPEEKKMHWYVVKVQSGREESIRDAIERRVKIEGLEEFFSKIIIPVEKTAEMRNGKRVVKERKLYPGYLMVEVEYNDRILYLFRETSGVGDFVGGSLQHAPAPMTGREVERMLGRQGEKDDVKVIHQKPKYDRGDRVKVKEGTFAGMEGEVKELIEAKGQVRMELTIFGRPVLVELEYWQVEHV